MSVATTEYKEDNKIIKQAHRQSYHDQGDLGLVRGEREGQRESQERDRESRESQERDIERVKRESGERECEREREGEREMLQDQFFND